MLFVDMNRKLSKRLSFRFQARRVGSIVHVECVVTVYATVKNTTVMLVDADLEVMAILW
jgi:hypothetical protein